MLPKRTCPSCNKKTIRCSSTLKNLLISNEGSRCPQCNSLVLVKQTYIETLKYPFGLLSIIMVFTGIMLLTEFFFDFTKGSFLDGSLFLVFLNLLVMSLPLIGLILLYCYFMPIVTGSNEDVLYMYKMHLIIRFLEVLILIAFIVAIFYFF